MAASPISAFSLTASDDVVSLCVILSCLAGVLWLWHQTKGRFLSQGKAIPGPRQLPILGNIGQVSPARQHPQFLKWARHYGPIFQLRFGSNRFVVLNTAKATVDLLDRRSGIYSSRSGPHFAHDLMSQGQRMVFLEYGPEWKACRASLHPYLMGPRSLEYRSTQANESAVLMSDLLHFTKAHLDESKAPSKHEIGWEAWVRRYTTSVVMSITYGHRITSASSNRDLHKIYDVLATLTRVGQPGSWLCDDFPVVRLLPDWMATWRKEGLRLHRWEMKLWGGFLDRLKGEMQAGTATPSYAHDVLNKRVLAQLESTDTRKPSPLNDLLLSYTAATVLEAGSDTTASSVYFFVLVCLNQPEIMQKLQAEVDSKVPRTRLPDFEDVADMPYLHGCVKETLRRRPPTIMGIPHAVTRDDIYEGYHIAKGTTVIGNVWAIHMDPERYPDPLAFRPERFTDSLRSSAESAATFNPDLRDHFAFGWGRRICQGMHIAEASLTIILARLAWSFNISAPPASIMSFQDEDSFLDGFVSQTKPFLANFIPRDNHTEMVLKEATETAQSYWAAQGMESDEQRSFK